MKTRKQKRKETWREKKKARSLNLLEIVSGDLCAINEEEWEDIVLTVDSGAAETVVNKWVATCIKEEESEGSRKGVLYECANGERINNEGQMVLKGVTEDG